jgi:hypothetical protein
LRKAVNIARKIMVLAPIIALVLLTTLIPTQKVSADSPPAISSGSPVSGLVDDFIPITGLEITGDSVDPIPVTLTVASGQLSMTTTDGLTFSRGPVGSRLAFTGSKADINAALATLQYRTTRPGTVDLSVTLTNPGLVYFPGNGHLYEVVSGPSISWDDAKIAAEARTVNGAQGYLATVTTQEENDYISARLEDSGWFGASDAETEGDWKWVTGPEAGTSFWSGLGDGATVNGGFAAWAPGEPNDSGGEDCAQYYPSGDWNDLPCDGPFLSRYVVEYGAEGDLPTAPSNTTVAITTTLPVPEEIDVSSCLDLIDVASTNQNDNRYDNLTLTGDIDCEGETIAPLFNDVLVLDEDEGLYEFLGFRGTFDGNGHTISNLNITAPETENTQYIRTGFFAVTDGATIQDVNFVGGTINSNDEWTSCTGGVVGQALNTSFSNITTSLTVTGGAQYNSSVGGIVGCLAADDGESIVEDVSVAGSVTGYDDVGGVVGEAEVSSAGIFDITDTENNALIQVVNNGWEAGGIIGSVDAYGEGSMVSILRNTSIGLSVEAGSVGGIVGGLDSDDGAEVTMDANEVTGNIEGQGTLGGLLGQGDVEDDGKLYISNSDLTIDVGTSNDYSYVGGVVGELDSEGNSEETRVVIEDVSFDGEVIGGYAVGGISGTFCADYGDEEMIMRGVSAAGSIVSNGSDVGGLVGYTCDAEISESVSTSAVEGYDDVGGLVGDNDDTLIFRSYSTGNITASDGPVGGIVGRNSDDSVIEESYATGNVTGVQRVGGIAGANGALILNSYARGAVQGENQVGGIAGRCGGAIQKSYTTGLVTGENQVGGIVGSDQGCDVTDTFWDTDTTEIDSTDGGGAGKTTQEMKTIATYTSLSTEGLDESWDFGQVWSIDPGTNDGYPCHIWAGENCVSSDEDSDGIDNDIENAGPNNGDANNDGTPDGQQAHVASWVNPLTNEYVAVVVDEACSVTSAAVVRESTLAVQDSGYDYRAGFINFTANCGTPGYQTTAQVYQYGANASGLLARKHNPQTNAFFTISGASLSQVTIGGLPATRATYTITDGELLDVDGQANGVIVDPVGLAMLVVGAPNTGLR